MSCRAGPLDGGDPLGWLKAPARHLCRAGAWRASCSASSSRRGGRLRRLSGAADAARRALAQGSPTALHEQNAVLGRVNRLLARPGRCDRDRLSRRSTGCRPTLAPRSRWSAIRCAPRCWRCATQPYPPLGRGRHLPRCWSPAAARARACCRRSCPMGWRCCRSRCATRLQVTQQCRPEDIEQRARALCRARHRRRARHLSRATARAAGWSASVHRPRRRLDHRRADRRRAAPRSSCRCRSRPTITRPPTRARSSAAGGARVDPASSTFTPQSSSPSRCRRLAAASPSALEMPRERARGRCGYPDATARPRRSGRELGARRADIPGSAADRERAAKPARSARKRCA